MSHISISNRLARPRRVWVRPPAGPDDGITIPPVPAAAQKALLVEEVRSGTTLVQCVVRIGEAHASVDPAWVEVRA